MFSFKKMEKPKRKAEKNLGRKRKLSKKEQTKGKRLKRSKSDSCAGPDNTSSGCSGQKRASLDGARTKDCQEDCDKYGLLNKTLPGGALDGLTSLERLATVKLSQLLPQVKHTDCMHRHLTLHAPSYLSKTHPGGVINSILNNKRLRSKVKLF